MGQKTKIDWCDSTWNPVTGCLHGCEYCYARRIAERFGLPFAPRLDDPGMEGARKYDSAIGTDTMLELTKPLVRYGRKQPYPMGFNPTFHRYKLDEPQKWKKPRTIFVCSMADLFGSWVPDEWIKEILCSCEKAPQHKYIFLTKNQTMYNVLDFCNLLPRNHNFWYGTTATKPATFTWSSHSHNTFVSIEPIQERFQKIGNIEAWKNHDWYIIGAETGNRKGKIVPQKEWIEEIVEQAHEAGRPVFMKESLRGIMGDDFRQEYPWN